MRRTLMKSKIHRATVTQADLSYEGSISIDEKLCETANILPYERVEIYNCNNGNRFATYAIHGRDGQICLNGAAARLAHPGDVIIICTFAEFEEEEARRHQPVKVFVDAQNRQKVL